MEYKDRGVDVLHIILFILKILGYILLTVLGLLLLVLLITLFVPVKYQFFGSYEEKPDLFAKITWLFGLIKVHAKFCDKQFQFNVKVAWKTLFDIDNQKKESKDLPEEESLQNNSNESVITDGSETHASLEDKAEEKLDEATPEGLVPDKIEAVEGQTDVDGQVRLQKESSDSSKSKEHISGLKKRTNALFSKKKTSKKKKEKVKKEKRSILETIQCKIEMLFECIDNFFEKTEDKMNELSCKWHKIEKFLSAECTKNSINLLLKMLKSILKHLAPKDIQGRVHFGMDKPSKTGKILGYASAFYPLYSNKVQLEPDFEKAIIEGHLNMRGGIRLYIFVFWALRLILCKDVRKLIKYVKHLKK